MRQIYFLTLFLIVNSCIQNNTDQLNCNNKIELKVLGFGQVHGLYTYENLEDVNCAASFSGKKVLILFYATIANSNTKTEWLNFQNDRIQKIINDEYEFLALATDNRKIIDENSGLNQGMLNMKLEISLAKNNSQPLLLILEGDRVSVKKHCGFDTIIYKNKLLTFLES